MATTIRAVIFDLDGTLVDSEPVYRQSEGWLAASLGIQLDSSSADDFLGVSTAEYLGWLRQQHNIALSLPQLCDLQTELFLTKGLPRVRPFGATVDFLQSLAAGGVPLALASGSERRAIDAMLGRFDLSGYFSVILASSEVGRSKPAADVFLAAAAGLGVAAQQCLVLEDSVPGLQAARAAGMGVVAINTQPEIACQTQKAQKANAQRMECLRTADVFFASMAEFSARQIHARFPLGSAKTLRK